MPIFLDIMREELERNIMKQNAFQKELESLPKGYLSVCVIGGQPYVYRKRREKNKIISEYIGIPGDKAVQEAEENRAKYIQIKESIKNLKAEEIKLLKAIKEFEK